MFCKDDLRRFETFSLTILVWVPVLRRGALRRGALTCFTHGFDRRTCHLVSFLSDSKFLPSNQSSWFLSLWPTQFCCTVQVQTPKIYSVEKIELIWLYKKCVIFSRSMSLSVFQVPMTHVLVCSHCCSFVCSTYHSSSGTTVLVEQA